MTTLERPRTVGELRASGYKVLPVREEMRKNLIEKLRRIESLLPLVMPFHVVGICVGPLPGPD